VRSRFALALVAAAVALAGAAGCPPPRAPGPAETVRAYADAVAAGRVDAAYGLMSDDYRRAHDRAAFERALGDRRGAAMGARLTGARVELAADVELDGGEKLPLVREAGGWRIARDPLEFYPQRTPDEALRSFARAVEGQRYDVALRFVPARYRGQVTMDALRARWEGERRPELMAQLAAVRDALARGEPFEVSGDGSEARLAVGERKQARLVRENGLWKIDALE
jgi:hypothetical protein